MAQFSILKQANANRTLLMNLILYLFLKIRQEIYVLVEAGSECIYQALTWTVSSCPSIEFAECDKLA
jgi:hypothetical protein